MLTIFKFQNFTVRYWFNTNKTLVIHENTCVIDKMDRSIHEYQKSFTLRGSNIISYIDKK